MEARSVQLLLMAAILCCRTESSPFPQRVLKSFSLEEVVPLKDFYPERLTVQWISDTEFIRREPGAGILKFNALSHSLATILSENELYNLKDYMVSSFSENGKYILLASNKKKVYRYSSIAEYSVYDLENKSVHKIGQGPLQVVVWSSGSGLAYVYNNNVFYLSDASRPETVTQLTTEGVPGEVYFGATDWIYEEEIFNAAEAMWFSPSGTYLAIASFNDTLVESAIYPYYGNASDINNQYPELVQFKYPKAGRVNPQVGLRVVKLDDPTTEPWVIPAPVDVVGIDHILGRVNWAPDQNLVVLWLNRRQSTSILINCDLKQDKCSMVNEHTEHNGWIDIHEPFFDRTGTKMVEIKPLYHEDQRFPHAARLDFNTLTIEDLSPGNSTVTEILGWDQDTDTVYYIVAPSSMPWQRQLWATKQGVVRCISCKEPSCHYTSASFSQEASFGIVTCSSTNVPPKIYLYRCEDDKFSLIKDNAPLSEKLSHYKLPPTLFNVLPLGDDVTSHVKLLLPPDMQKGVQYPMVVRVYAGPGTSRVKDNYDLEFYNMYLSSNRSFIVAAIDVRGSGVMGVEAMHAVNTALGTVEITDTLAAIRRLVELYSFIDPKRIGVWGWSYGGFATTMMLIQDDKKIMACGAAVAPVTSWLYYDSIYTERYMDTPIANPTGYQRSDLTAAAEKLRGRRFLLIHGTGDDNVHYQHSMQLAKQLQHADIAFEQMIWRCLSMDTPTVNPTGYQRSDLTAAAEKLRGRRFLLIHGTGDDNVHYQHSMQLAKQLQHADIAFEQMSYTDENHSLMGVSRHFYHTLDHFWTECFQ